MKDRLFIFITVVLLALIAMKVISNMPQKETGLYPIKGIKELRTSEIISDLEAAGLKPKEAEYYTMIDE